MKDREIIDYAIVSHTDPVRFEFEVNRLLNAGWSVYGNVAHGYIEDCGDRTIVSRQVLVKYEKTDTQA